MTSRDFCYWLQGFFEVTENKQPITVGTDAQPIELTEQQIKVIREHLNLVFKHELDPSNLDGKSTVEKREYEEIHKGRKSDDFFHFNGNKSYNIVK